MASKKYLFLTALCSLLAVSQVFGQSSAVGGHDYLDTAYVPESRMEQQQSFLNNESIYPAKPRDMWELGVHGGYNWILGDVAAQPGFGAGLSLRKALGYTISLRADLGYLQAKGVGYQKVLAASNLRGTAAAAAYGNGSFYPDYKMTGGYASMDVIASLNNIMFHKEAPKVNWYVFAGYTALAYKTKVDALNGSSAYNNNFSGKRKDIIDAVKNAHDGSYETTIQSGNRTPNSNKPEKGPFLRHSLDAGVGVAFKISPHFNIGVEQKFLLPFDDYVDGVSHGVKGVNTSSPDIISYSNVRLNFDLGNTSKRTAPLWWENPLGYAYNELNAPRHMKLPEPVLPDADGDGIADQFDKCPNTPSGAPVDVHGCALDTDGDGVPDYKDKQLITPTYCQPVDEDGVGKCPCPDDCKAAQATCDLGTLPSITFSGNGVSLSNDAKTLLANVANQMRQSPDCRVVVTGHAEASKRSEQLAWDRVNSIINYMTEQEGIPASRFIFQYHGVPGDTHTVDLRSANPGDEGPNMVPPPHPNLRRSK